MSKNDIPHLFLFPSLVRISVDILAKLSSGSARPVILPYAHHCFLLVCHLSYICDSATCPKRGPKLLPLFSLLAYVGQPVVDRPKSALHVIITQASYAGQIQALSL